MMIVPVLVLGFSVFIYFIIIAQNLVAVNRAMRFSDRLAFDFFIHVLDIFRETWYSYGMTESVNGDCLWYNREHFRFGEFETFLT